MKILILKIIFFREIEFPRLEGNFVSLEIK